MSYIDKIDSELSEAIKKEAERQEYKLNLIASENYASRAVLASDTMEAATL